MHAIILPPATPAASTAIVLSPPAGQLSVARPLARQARRRVDLLALAAATAAYRRHNDTIERAS